MYHRAKVDCSEFKGGSCLVISFDDNGCVGFVDSVSALRQTLRVMHTF